MQSEQEIMAQLLESGGGTDPSMAGAAPPMAAPAPSMPPEQAMQILQDHGINMENAEMVAEALMVAKELMDAQGGGGGEMPPQGMPPEQMPPM